MDKALHKAGREAAGSREVSNLDWRRKVSDHVAYALLVYTGLQIFMTVGALKSATGSILPYFALILLVGAIIPGCRLVERRWEVLSDSQAANPELEGAFKRDRMLIWIAALGLPLAITGLFKGIALFA